MKSIDTAFFQFVSQGSRVVNFSQRFRDCGGINADGARLFIGENAIEHERLNIAVKNNTDEFVGFVDDGTAAVATDDVSIGNEIEFRRQSQLGFAIDPAL